MLNLFKKRTATQRIANFTSGQLEYYQNLDATQQVIFQSITGEQRTLYMRILQLQTPGVAQLAGDRLDLLKVFCSEAADELKLKEFLGPDYPYLNQMPTKKPSSTTDSASKARIKLDELKNSSPSLHQAGSPSSKKLNNEFDAADVDTLPISKLKL